MTYTLGRLVEHDPRSRAFLAAVAPQPRTVTWEHEAPVLDQGDVGSCTGNALAQWLNTNHGMARPGLGGFLVEYDALTLYRLATRLDGFPGRYPPTDTGSSGGAVCKAGVQLGYLTAYRWTFSFMAFLGALARSPVLVGTEWYEGMFEPNPQGFIRPTGEVAGGHEYLILGCDVDKKTVTLLNSWSDQWGQHGRAHLSWADMALLLRNQGDVKVPIL
jgi:hypothetical protein